MASQADVVQGVANAVESMVERRLDKLRNESHDTMAVSPFLLPILVDLHDAASFDELADLLLASHLMTGHFTSFGKLIDEKILPAVFGTTKLDRAFRQSVKPYEQPCFDEIDHLVGDEGVTPTLLSMKASRWTIQLSMARELNAQFNRILTDYPGKFSEIVVGVFYGKSADLTDKYDIVRGINRGMAHAVDDLTGYVRVLAGRDFWSWVNDGENDTQHWVLDGILKGLDQADCSAGAHGLLDSYKASFRKKFEAHLKNDGQIDWHGLLKELSG